MTDLSKLEALGIEDLQRERTARAAHRVRRDMVSAMLAERSPEAPATAFTHNPALSEFDDAALTSALQVKLDAVYGYDHRQDLYSEFPLMDFVLDADGVLGVFSNNRVVDNYDGTSTLTLESYADKYVLCPNERFRDQSLGPLHTAFLVAPDIVATVGSSIDESLMSQRKFVFGFRMKSATDVPHVVKNSDVYIAKAMIGRKVDPGGTDWALVQLDRPVTDHRVLQIRRSGQLNTQFIHMLGHPCGLPLKYVDRGLIRNLPPSPVFVSSLTAYLGNHTVYTGNAGSPVFDSATNLVEGVHCRNDADFNWNGTCNTSRVYGEYEGSGSEATRTTEFAHLLSNYAPFSLVTFAFAHVELAFATTTAPDGDIFAVQNAASASGFMSLYIFKPYRYQVPSVQETGLEFEAGSKWTFAVASNLDLFAIKQQGCQSNRTEVHILSAASNYKSFSLHVPTPIEMTDDTWTFGVTNNRDIIGIKKKSGTQKTEVHLLSADSNYQQFSYQGTSVLPETDSSWDFAVSASHDVYAIHKTGGASNSTEISIMRFADRWKSIVSTTGSVLPPTDASWSFAIDYAGNVVATRQPKLFPELMLGQPTMLSQIRVIKVG
ncbi:MAG TPA: trypsin-like peptidase domain-containing protein [Xanthomonadaceae bacterium]|jgi:hypothetical protein|nr:trypsin-like peptidase domain-containing protein [Xanthomonadaceae bacterium]